ncbi:MAG: DUF2169 domain-containing protein [Rubellimicrobium sp.]|nr:DUF2169 domain-containing protein [Rubellimicrobium sp.]
MKLSSLLPVAAMYFRHWHTDDTEVGIVVAKAEFRPDETGKFRAVPKPAPLCLVDEFEGDPATSPLLREQEISPGKRGTDLTIRAIARAPGGKPLPDWAVSVRIPDRLYYEFRVRGPSEWRRGLLGWRQSDPEPMTEMPISYAYAFGGPARGNPEMEHPPVFEENPAGLGHATSESLAGKQSFAAPRIGALAEFIAAEPGQQMTVHGFGPIAKAWLPRRGFAGTFDENWKTTRHPRMPRDYDLAFWNAAPTPLQIVPGLAGTESILLQGIRHAPEPVALTLPGVRLHLLARGEGGNEERVSLTLDTVDLDLRAPDAGAAIMTLVWRGLVTGPGRFQSGEIQSERIGDR